MYLLDLPLTVLALLGYTGMVVHATNRLRATRISRRLVGPASDFCFLSILAAGPLILIVYFLVLYYWNIDPNGRPLLLRASPALIFFIPCWFFALAVMPFKFIIWIGLKNSDRATTANLQLVDLTREGEEELITGWKARLAGSFFPNQVTLLDTADIRLDMPRLDRVFEGLTITHLSDLHFTGRFTREFYRRVIESANEKESDLVVITGDIIDNPRTIPWLPETLGRLRAKHGVFCVLGNHDYESTAAGEILKVLAESGVNWVGGQAASFTMETENGPGTIVIAGNEHPWGPAPTVDALEETSLLEKDRPVLKILLSHSPDQYAWAREHDFDLILAGHTHGGQIRLPWWGPIVCPSRHGLRYASGCYYEPPTVLCVSRGISGETPIRINCPPQMPRYVLGRDSNQK